MHGKKRREFTLVSHMFRLLQFAKVVLAKLLIFYAVIDECFRAKGSRERMFSDTYSACNLLYEARCKYSFKNPNGNEFR